jgi:hypothetical protein
MTRFDLGTFLWGVAFAVLGGALALEAMDVWTLKAVDLRFVGPALVIVIGLGLVARSLASGREQQ